jgi:hypothetical protein
MNLRAASVDSLAMAKQYRLNQYTVAPRAGQPNGEEANALMDEMTENGWEVHTAHVSYPEVHILWVRDSEEKETKAKAAPQRGRRAGAPNG